jgi:hypothetical protein
VHYRWLPDLVVRSPCPVLNALANHHILPHDGRGITKEKAVQAITTALNVDFQIAVFLVGTAIKEFEKDQQRKDIQTFSLDELNKHGLIEHDVSLSRNDAALGDNHTFDPTIFNTFINNFGDATETSFASASAARYSRVVAARYEHELENKGFMYALKQYVLSYGETGLLLAVLGDPKEGKVPLEYLKVLFRKWFLNCLEGSKLTAIIGEERLPYNEGWRPIDTAIKQSDINHMIFGLIEANEHKETEAVDISVATMFALRTVVRNILPSYCTIMWRGGLVATKLAVSWFGTWLSSTLLAIELIWVATLRIVLFFPWTKSWK